MNKYLFPIYAVIAGYLIVRIWINSGSTKSLQIKLLLAFSGAFLLSMTLFDLLPEVYSYMEPKQIGLWIMLGILIQVFLEFFSKGAEHGHIHIHSDSRTFPWLLFISLCIHAFLEGFPIHQHNDMVYGVLIHKIPIAILITSFLIRSGFKQITILFFLLIFMIMTPMGTLISNMDLLSKEVLQAINAIVIGIFFHISTTILFESSEGHSFNAGKLLVIASAIVLAYLF